MTQTSNTPENIAAGLSTAMVAAMLSGTDNLGRVTGKTNTLEALIARGLVTGGEEHWFCWTDLGREVAQVLHASALTEDVERTLEFAGTHKYRPFDGVQGNRCWYEDCGAGPQSPVHTDRPIESPTADREVTRASDGVAFAVHQHVTVEGFPGVTWLITEVYATSAHGEAAATVWTAPASGYGQRLVPLRLLTHAFPQSVAHEWVPGEGWRVMAEPEPADEQESAFLTPHLADASAIVKQALDAIGKLQTLAIAPTPVAPDPVTTDVPPDLLARIVRRAQYLALQEVLTVVADWAAGARDNHEALQHRDRDCCDTFLPADIRQMVDDAASALGLPALPRASDR